MSDLIQQLHDIEGIDSVSAWPLAVGWWIVLAAALASACAFGFWLSKRRAFHRSWKSDALKQLTNLEERLVEATAKEAAATLSEYVRRIAIARFSRKDCAGLAGSDWLKWLAKRDPCRFDWENKGRFLIEAPYASQPQGLSRNTIKEIIHAVRKWVR